jgi:hypothetical protein
MGDNQKMGDNKKRGTTKKGGQQMLLNNECCGTTTNVVEQRMLWNNERCGTTREKTYYECCGTTNVVEQRMLWNNECCGTTNVRSQMGDNQKELRIQKMGDNRKMGDNQKKWDNQKRGTTKTGGVVQEREEESHRESMGETGGLRHHHRQLQPVERRLQRVSPWIACWVMPKGIEYGGDVG